MGETPMEWLTTRSVEVVTIEGLEGNWLKMDAKSAAHITRNKKKVGAIMMDLKQKSHEHYKTLIMCIANT